MGLHGGLYSTLHPDPGLTMYVFALVVLTQF